MINRLERIQNHLQSLNPLHLSLINESYMHSVPKDAQTHFKLIMVSECFQGLSKVKRHQMIYTLLKSEFDTGLHALSLHLFTSDEWQDQNEIEASPTCRGGNKK